MYVVRLYILLATSIITFMLYFWLYGNGIHCILLFTVYILVFVISYPSFYFRILNAFINYACLIGSPTHWSWILKHAKYLSEQSKIKDHQAVYRITINFNRWESALAKDDKALACHAHVHLLLTHEAQQALSVLPLFKALKGRGCPPEEYWLTGAEDLETKRLNGETLSVLCGEVDQVKSDVDQMKSDMQKMKSDMQNMMKMMEAMCQKNDISL